MASSLPALLDMLWLGYFGPAIYHLLFALVLYRNEGHLLALCKTFYDGAELCHFVAFHSTQSRIC